MTREGRDTWVPTRELVRGDVLRLTAGDVVGADARLVRSVQLQMDESLLTGEFQPSDRDSEAVSPGSTPMADRTGMVHASSTVLRSSGEAVVVATGVATVIGQVARLVGGRRSPLAPLQRVEAIRADLQRRTEELVADVVREEVALAAHPRSGQLSAKVQRRRCCSSVPGTRSCSSSAAAGGVRSVVCCSARSPCTAPCTPPAP